ncbi:MAG: hypothetical protein EP343_26665 [Deltaproteobacteria bacterium]|nr:MAG: hypothetical protein EP343_26665 [Deltaproteobacteria bacterium]
MQADQTGTEQAPTEQATGQKISFNPASGSTIDVKDFCIDITTASPVDKVKWDAKLSVKGSTVALTQTIIFASGTAAKVCIDEYLSPSTDYVLEVTLYDDTSGTPTTAKAEYKTKDTYATGKTADPGLTVDLQLSKVITPNGVNALIGTINPNQILPVLMHLHSRDTGTSGSITMVGGVGRTPSGNPHNGKDVFDNTKEPVAISMKGTFTGRLFEAGPTTFRLTVGGFKLELEQFRLSGLFNTAGDSFEDVRFSGIVDTAGLSASLGIDPCLLLVGACYKDAKGRSVMFMVGQMKSIKNPVDFSVLLTTPLYLQTGLATAAAKFDFYTTEEVKAGDVSIKLETCKNSGSNDKPCDTASGAQLTTVSATGSASINSDKKSGSYTLSTSLQAQTWYKISLTAKNASGTAYTTFTVFQTQ